MKYKEISKKEEVPEGFHYAALIFDTMWVEDGYGGNYSKSFTRYISFDDKASMEAWVISQETKTGTREAYQIIESRPQKVKLKASIELTPVMRSRNE